MDDLTVTLLVILGVFFVGIVFVSTVVKWNRFTRELERINMEIKRNTGSQREYWMRMKRRLWLSLLPFYRR